MDFDRDAYLRRVGLDSTVSNTEESLEALHRAQTFAIPFENLDIHLGRGVSLAQETLFDKLVNHRRGGYCFELNSLFGMALDAFGFERRPLLARSQRRGAPCWLLPFLDALLGHRPLPDARWGRNSMRERRASP